MTCAESSSEGRDPSRHESFARVASGVACGVVLLLFFYSAYLSRTRIYQVDEAQNVFMARVTALGTEQRYFSNGYLFLLGPLSWIAGRATTSSAMFSEARIVFLGLYWLNLALIPLAAGLTLRSRAYLFALLLVATLSPLLDYGLEIRHDNLMLALLLLFWTIARRHRGPAWIGFLLLGGVAGVLQFAAFKAFLYWLPLSLGILFRPPPTLKLGLLERGLFWLVGLACAVLIVRLAYGSGGAWEAYVRGVRVALGFSQSATRLSPWSTLQRLVAQTPFLLGGALVIGFYTLRESRRDGWSQGLGWQGSAPEALLCVVALLAFFANPTPYPYNLLHLLPFALVWLLRAARAFDVPRVRAALIRRRLWSVLLAVLLIGHGLTYVHFALRHLSFSNRRQVLLMNVAESLTEPARDRVFDASGLIASRESIGYQWFLHSLVMPRFASGELTPIWRQLQAHPPAVVLRSYRTDWMGRAEQHFLSEHYLFLADDLLVLGAVLPPGGGTFSCLHAGRYLLQPLDGAGKVSGGALSVDGRALSGRGVIELAAGARLVQATPSNRVQVVWVGPRLAEPPTLADRDHERLFVNWY